jgi:hypothetical protein
MDPCNAAGGADQAQCSGCGDYFSVGWGLYNHRERCGCGDSDPDDDAEDTDSERTYLNERQRDRDEGFVEYDEETFVATDEFSDGGSDVDDPLRVADYQPEDLQLQEPPAESDDEYHECNDDCECDAFDENEWDGGDMKYLTWGECDITESGRETLRFLSTVMKGKSMSQNKAEDFLR